MSAAPSETGQLPAHVKANFGSRLVELAPATALRYPQAFSWTNPDYVPVWAHRAKVLQTLELDPALVADFKLHYKWNPWDMVHDWGVTIDPRVAGQPGRTALMPFLLMPKQHEWMRWVFSCWIKKQPGVTVKSRDCGLSWLITTIGPAICLHWANVNIGYGSAKEDKVDRNGDPDCLFYKSRLFLRYLPRIFRGGWHPKRHSAHMVIQYPQTESSQTGEAGDNIGRGGRTAMNFIDESAHVERPKLIDASLAATTDCRQDVSSVNGSANSFAERAHNSAIARFDFHWRDDPRKSEEWARKKQLEVDPIVWGAEFEMNFNASVDGIIIPQTHVQAAIDLDLLVGIKPSGPRTGSLDVADQGMDKCAMAGRHGYLLERIKSWRGQGIINGREWDISDTNTVAFSLCDEWELSSFVYDADGLGASIRGHARETNEARREAKQPTKIVSPFRGSGAVVDPEKVFPGTERKAIDFFENAKAQAWWWLRQLFRNSYALRQYWEEHKRLPEDFDANKIIVLRGDMEERQRLCMELSQPVRTWSKTGKMMIDKQPEGVASPNLADAAMMAFAPRRLAVVVKSSHLESGT